MMMSIKIKTLAAKFQALDETHSEKLRRVLVDHSHVVAARAAFARAGMNYNDEMNSATVKPATVKDVKKWKCEMEEKIKDPLLVE
eukprot:2784422-Ditylum_brightwellii.AAC.1